jgi:hypothetical protein
MGNSAWRVFCKYVYPEGHDRAGEKCKSGYVLKSGPGVGYCQAHAKALGLLSPEYRSKLNESIKKGRNESEAKKREAAEEMLDMAEGDLNPGNLDSSGEVGGFAEKLFHDIVGDIDIDISLMVLELKKTNGIEMDSINKEIEVYAQSLFVMWWMADPKTRLPKKLSEFARIVKRPVYVIRKWLDQEWFYRKLDEGRMNRLKLLSPFVDRKNVIRALTGDRSATAEFYKQVGVIKDISRDKKSLEDGIPEELLEEAIDDTGLDKHDVRIKKNGEDELFDNLLGEFEGIDLNRE